MDNIKSTTARLRRTFQYPTDSSSSPGSPDIDVLDDEEQETLITTLAEQNSRRNLQFQRLLLALPLLSAVPYLLAISRPQTFLLSLLALSSLASTTYLLHRLPPIETGIPLLDNNTSWAGALPSGGSGADWGGGSARPVFNDGGYGGDYGGVGRDEEEEEGPLAGERASRQQRSRRGKRRASSFSVAAPHRSPLEIWLPYLNLGLCAVLVLLGLLMGTREHSTSLALVGLGNLPAVIYVVVLVAKMVMAGVDPERELGGLRYEYKGA